MNKTLVSVIIPFLNAELFLNDTIQSVVNQNYTDWELILINDGSTDKSIKVINEWVDRFPDKIFVYSHDNSVNKGAAASRNLGVSKAKGKLLAFLDADDLWLPDYLSVQITLFDKMPEVTVICEATKYWYSWNNPQSKDKIINVGAPVDTVYNPPELARRLYPLGEGDSFCTCALMIYTERLKALGGFNDTFTGTNQLFEDQVLFLKICLHERVYLSSNCNNIYRQRPNSLMHGLVSGGNHDKALIFFLNWLKDYITEQNIQDEQLHQHLKDAFLPYKYPYLYKFRNFANFTKLKVKSRLKKIIKRNK